MAILVNVSLDVVRVHVVRAHTNRLRCRLYLSQVQLGHDEIAHHSPGFSNVDLVGPVVVVFELIFGKTAPIDALLFRRQVFYGLFPAMVGTLALILLSVCWAIPLGIATGIYMAEYAGGMTKKTLEESVKKTEEIRTNLEEEINPRTECGIDKDCGEKEACKNGQCQEIICGACGIVKNHQCISYACCSDETCDDDDPKTYDRCQNPKTENSKCVNENVQKCNDGTAYGYCSVTKPLYCSNGTLINKCSVCGCSQGCRRCQDASIRMFVSRTGGTRQKHP